MTTITITFEDATMYIDKIGHSGLDISSAPIGYHALQWNGVSGWLELSHNEDNDKSPNETIDALPEWVADIEVSWQTVDALLKIKQVEFQATIDSANLVAIEMEIANAELEATIKANKIAEAEAKAAAKLKYDALNAEYAALEASRIAELEANAPTNIEPTI
jgi:hypothetical protein